MASPYQLLSSDAGNLQDLEFERSNHPSHQRSHSLTAFSFDPNSLPLSLSAEEHEGSPAQTHRHLGFLSGIALVVGLQVGSGIFSSPGVIVQSVGSAGASLLVWIIAGLLAWSGASSFAELGSAIVSQVFIFD